MGLLSRARAAVGLGGGDDLAAALTALGAEGKFLSRARAHFMKADKDGSGGLSAEELCKVLRVPMDTYAKALMRILDKDGNGVVQFEEWVAGMGRFAARGDEIASVYRLAFLLFDTDGSGKLSRHELQTAFRDSFMEQLRGGFCGTGLFTGWGDDKATLRRKMRGVMEAVKQLPEEVGFEDFKALAERHTAVTDRAARLWSALTRYGNACAAASEEMNKRSGNHVGPPGEHAQFEPDSPGREAHAEAVASLAPRPLGRLPAERDEGLRRGGSLPPLSHAPSSLPAAVVPCPHCNRPVPITVGHGPPPPADAVALEAPPPPRRHRHRHREPPSPIQEESPPPSPTWEEPPPPPPPQPNTLKDVSPCVTAEAGVLVKRSYNMASLQVVRRIFSSADMDGSKTLELQEFCAAFGLQNNAYTELLMRLFDDDCNGTVTFPEFVKGAARFAGIHSHELARFTYNLFDREGSGRVSRDEIVWVMRANFSSQAKPREGEPPDPDHVDLTGLLQELKAIRGDGVTFFDFQRVAALFPGALAPVRHVWKVVHKYADDCAMLVRDQPPTPSEQGPEVLRYTPAGALVPGGGTAGAPLTQQYQQQQQHQRVIPPSWQAGGPPPTTHGWQQHERPQSARPRGRAA